MSELDNIDRQLISMLRTDARTSVSDLAKKIMFREQRYKID
jgi:DNA-binding Lrp family transcriptional regulator